MVAKLFNKSKLILLAIVLIGAFFRFYDVNWDQNQHLHPDERFLTMVGTAMKIPPSFIDYIVPQVSTVNPANIGYSFYVYGTFPVVVNKLLAIATGNDNYNSFALLGRVFSGFVDLLVVVFVFKTAEIFEKRYNINHHIKYWAAFFYAIAVLPIQLSHFFAVDTFISSFSFISFYFALRYSVKRNGLWLLLSGVFLGLGLASKATAIFITPLALYFLINAYSEKNKVARRDLPKLLLDIVLWGVTIYLACRIADPYLFQTGNFLDLEPSKLFLSNLKQLASWSNPQAWYPPGVQWIHKTPIIFGLKNLTLYGVGIGYTICISLGFFFLFKKIRYRDIIAVFSWVFVFFLYQSLQSVQTMRYFLIIYPFLAFFAGIGFAYTVKQAPRYVQALLLLLVIIWPLMFFSIYTKPISRVTASQWIYYTFPTNSVILTESWDDALPLPIFDMSNRHYLIKELPVFDPDTTQKWNTMDSMLSQGDYLILSSNRGWGSIPTVPERYPRMTAFYKNLLSGKTDYKEIAQFTSYPSLAYLGIPLTLNDDGAEEAFTVYDHPKVMIFKHIR